MIDSTIAYKGKVTVKIKNKPPVVIKNNGTRLLFQALTKALALPSKFSDAYCEELKKSMPTYAQVYCFSAEWDGTPPTAAHSKLLNDVPIVRCQWMINEYEVPCVQYSFYITKSNLWSNLINTLDTHLSSYSYLVLLDANRSVLAFINIDLSDTEDTGLDVKDWEPAQQAAITWELSFTNVT